MIISVRTAKDNEKKQKFELAALIGCTICVAATMVFAYLKLSNVESTANLASNRSSFLLSLLTVFIMLACAFAFLICFAISLTHPPLRFVNSSYSHYSNIDPNVNHFVENRITTFVEGEVIRFESIILGISAAERIIAFLAVVDFFLFAMLYTVTL